MMVISSINSMLSWLLLLIALLAVDMNCYRRASGWSVSV